MMKRLLGLVLLIACFAGNFSVFAIAPQIRPVEISGNEIQRRPGAVPMESQDLGNWRIESENVSDVSLTLSGDAPLWEDQVARLAFAVTDIEKATKITLYPTKKLLLPAGNTIEMWLNGPQLFHAYLIGYFRSSDGKTSRSDFCGGGHQWNFTSYWGNALSSRPPLGVPPWHLEKLELTIKPAPGAAAGKQQVIYFDEFASLNRSLAGIPLKWRNEYPKPTTLDTILPSVKGKSPENSVSLSGKSYRFSVGNELAYIYTPVNGTFSDLHVELQDGTAFQLTKGGGPQAIVNGVEIDPQDAAVEAVLLKAELKNNRLMTQWRRTKDGQSFGYTLEFEVKQRTLIITAHSTEPVITLLAVGYTNQTPGLELIEPSYFNTRHTQPHIAYYHKMFAACTLDWYTSNANALLDDGADLNRVLGRAIVGPNQVRLSGCSTYRKLSDGSRNTLYDRLFITVSSDLDEVLPNIANPPSPYMTETSRRVYCTRANFLTSPGEVDKELAFWRKMRAYGLEDMALRFHMEVMGTPVESNRLSRELNANSGLGDEALHKLIDGLHKLGFIVSGYQNDMVMHALSPEYDINKVALDYAFRPHQRWNYNNYLPRASVMVQNAVDFYGAYKNKWNWDGVYADEVTNSFPFTDYEAGIPGAGQFKEYLYATMLMLKKEKEIINGPVWSEGTAQMYLAGYTDMNYAQSNHPDWPVIPNFQLNKLHLLENDIGYELSVHKSHFDVDYWLASTIVFGNMGSIYSGKTGNASGRWDNTSLMAGSSDLYRDFGTMTKSYFMIRALQECYSGVAPELIMYTNARLEPVTLREAIEAGTTNNNLIHVKYANGLEVWVNRHARTKWNIDFGDRKMMLPPNGYAAVMPGKILEYSAGEPRQDYVSSDLYTYVDGRGVIGDFPEITAKGAYLICKEKNGLRLVPQATAKPETVVLKNLKKIRNVTAVHADGKRLNVPVIFTQKGQDLELAVDGKAFQYQIEF